MLVGLFVFKLLTASLARLFTFIALSSKLLAFRRHQFQKGHHMTCARPLTKFHLFKSLFLNYEDFTMSFIIAYMERGAVLHKECKRRFRLGT